jgi:hypothetical protein
VNAAPGRSLDQLLADHAARAVTLSPEARYYWQRHAVRFAFVLHHLDRWERAGTRRVLDVGASFQTQLLAAFFPDWQIDTLGLGRDHRFALPSPSRHFDFDLNAAADRSAWPALPGAYNLIVFMEVIEHLTVPPARVLEFLAAQLAPGGRLVLTTPNAAWLKNRLKLLCGRNPFEMLRDDRGGHIREYTLAELTAASANAGLTVHTARRLGLYGFAGAKDRFYNAVANATFPGLRRSIFLVLQRPP